MPAMFDCPHFGVCGGCAIGPSAEGRPRPPAYEDELRSKDQRVREFLTGVDVDSWHPILAAPRSWRYRNKMEFAFGELREMPFRLGLREAGRFDRIVDLETCGLVSEAAVEVLRATKAWAKEERLSGYNRFSHQGDLRYLVVREGHRTGQRMAFVIASPSLRGHAGWERLAERLRPLTTTVLAGFTDTRSDVARAADMQTLSGPGYIEERLLQFPFRISPYSFFQTNTLATEGLYRLLRERLTAWGGGALLDLYCGSGGIALTLADLFDRVIGVDTNREGIDDARANAERHGLATAEFVCEDALEFLRKLPGSKLFVQLSAIVVDPPRAGLHPKALAALLELNPPRLAYVSCNPESLARDLRVLGPYYRARSVQAVDLFPHTTHVETVCLLEHR